MAVSVSIWQLKPGRFRLRCRVTGQRDAYRFVAGTRAEAEAAGAVWQAEIEAHGQAPASPTITLGGWLAQLMALNTHLQPGTRDLYDGLIRRHFSSISGRRIGRLTPADGVNFQRALLDDGCGAVTVRHCFRLARSALAEAARLRIIPANPFAEVRSVRGRPADVKVPSSAQFGGVMHAGDGRTGVLLRLALATGARRNELLRLTWHQVDLAAGTLTIDGALLQRQGVITEKATKTKAGRRTITVPPAMVAELRQLRAEAGQVALAEGRQIGSLPVLPDADGVSWWSPMAATKAAKRALVAANVPGSLHGLRHAHATALLQARVNPRAVQQRLGHGNVSTTLATYAHAMPGDDEAAAAAIAAAIEGKSA
jgi:integrase